MLPAPEAMQVQNFFFPLLSSSSHTSLNVSSYRHQGNHSQQLSGTQLPLLKPGFARSVLGTRQFCSNGLRRILLTEVSISDRLLVTILNFASSLFGTEEGYMTLFKYLY